jgi:hypothetical protein
LEIRMPLNINNPFAQAIVAEGRKRGYNDYAIAASLGSGMAESGLNPASRPGDNGSAHGGFQWRGDRYTGLQRTAAQMGLDENDPRVQAAHWFNEADTSESKWGLKNAKSIDEAGNAAISMLRPAGWQAGAPQGGHNYSGRMAYAQQALAALHGGDPSVIADANSSQNPNVPGDFAGGSGGDQLSGGSGGDQLFDGDSGGALNSSFLSGGPGALFGRPQEGWNVGDTLTRVGASMMARDNPTGATAIMKGIDNDAELKRTKLYLQAQGKLQRQQNTHFIQDKDGRKIYALGPTGNVINTTELGPAPEKPINPKTMDYLEKQKGAADQSYDTLDKLNYYRNLIADGKLDLSAISQFNNSYKNLMNAADPKVANAARFTAFIEDLRNNRLLEAKGVQTEGDAIRAMQAILPGNAGYDNHTTLALLDDASDSLNRAYHRHYQALQNGMNQYKSYDPDGIYSSEAKDRESRLSAFQPEYTKKRDAFWAGTGGGSTGGAPGGTPSGMSPEARAAQERILKKRQGN